MYGISGWPATAPVASRRLSGRPRLDPTTVPGDVAPRAITSVGNYAIRFNWDDGHNTGIYSYEYLRALGESDVARAANV